MGALTRLAPRLLRDLLRDLADALGFFTRLPLPVAPSGFDLARMAWAAPVAGAAIGLIGAAALGLAHGLGLPPLFAAGVATTAMIAASGGLHEDGLADVADGFGGGSTRERRLEIMRDSRIGAYGASALALALILRVAALAAALGAGAPAAAGALVAVSALARAGALLPLAALKPARLDGLGAAAMLPAGAFGRACGIALIIAVVAAAPAFGPGRTAAAAAGALLGSVAVTALARARIGGQTGDVAGAAEQWAELGAWAGLLIGSASA